MPSRDADALATRRERATTLLADLVRWAAGRSDVRGVAVVGSYARGAERAGSDLDVVVLVDDVSALLGDDAWVRALAPGAVEIGGRRWGPFVTERRFALPDGLVVELDVTAAPWASVPLDAGTRAVLRRGARIAFDPDGRLALALAAANRAAD